MDLARLKELIDLMNRHQLEELEVEEEGFRARLRKRAEGPRFAAIGDVGGGALHAPASAAAGAAPPVARGPAAEDPGVVASPMVGTFYRSPGPEADPFVEVGDRIEEGKVICIIEAMKVMNEIRAERSGRLEEIFVSNGQPVQYGQPLFRLS